MRAVVQRVTDADVRSEGKISGTIGKGFVVLLGVEDGDTIEDMEYIARKVANLRVFEDEAGKMNLGLKDVNGEVLSVSQFTLLGDVRKGNRPSFTQASEPNYADSLYEKFNDALRNEGIKVETGVFQTDMLVRINNDGPVTILLDSRRLF